MVQNESIDRDSYLEAYQQSHGPTTKSDRDLNEAYPYPAPQPVYGAPPSGPPKYAYGPPVAPIQNYGPPVAIYGPPLPPQQPHGMLSLLDHFKFKLDLFTIGKILLKIVIFKKIVSFIAILCLLLFIPSLKKKVDDAIPGDEEDDGEMRTYGPKKYRNGDEILSNISSFVTESIEKFSNKYNQDVLCYGIYCESRKVVQRINKKIDPTDLVKLHASEKK